MRSRSAVGPSVVILLALLIQDMSGRSAAGGPELAFAAMEASVDMRVSQQPSRSRPPRDDASDAEIGEAVAAIEGAEGYRDLLAAIERQEDVIASTRMVRMADEQLQDPALEAAQRSLLVLLRQLSLECRQRGAEPAARLLGVRLIAGYALLADSPEQFANVLEKFSPLAADLDPPLIREALDTPGNTWPKPLFPLMEQLARDWREAGALAAATRMAEAAGTSAPPQGPVPTGIDGLVGHWLVTRIVFESPRDEHLVLRADGTAETWVVTASDRTAPKGGRWSSEGKTLGVDWEDGSQWSQPFTFHEGRLVFPNVPNRRQIWDRID